MVRVNVGSSLHMIFPDWFLSQAFIPHETDIDMASFLVLPAFCFMLVYSFILMLVFFFLPVLPFESALVNILSSYIHCACEKWFF
jgi:hypothetical protein